MPINNSVRVTLKMRSDIAANWTNNNPVLAQGEFGLESNSFLLKIGDGVTAWNNLRYLNKLDSQYLTIDSNGQITFSAGFQDQLDDMITTAGGTITGTLSLTGSILNGTDAVNKTYVDTAVANAGHLKREIVLALPTAQEADVDTIYMIKDNNAAGADKYKEYMKISGVITQIGDTSVDLAGLITGAHTAGNLLMVNSNGELVDSGIASADIGKLEPGTSSVLGGVKSSTADDFIYITTASDTAGEGFMTLNRVSTSKLYVPAGDTLVLDGGSSSGGIISNG